jgi:hypothetical protein
MELLKINEEKRKLEVMVKFSEENTIRVSFMQVEKYNFCYIYISITIASNDCNVKFLKMAKEISKVVKLQVKGGAANPSPPVGPALELLVNIMESVSI